MNRRGSGVLLHITSLPSPYGVGDLGPMAFRFADFLAKAKQRYWQILPLNPTDPAHGNCPYHSISAFACNTLLISTEGLLADGILDKADLEHETPFKNGVASYVEAVTYRRRILNTAWKKASKEKKNFEFEKYCEENHWWLDDFALFVSLKERFGGKPWYEWPRELRDRKSEALESAKKELFDNINREKFSQYLFWRQWSSLKRYCNEKAIHIIGDMPIYVVHDSVDVWCNPHIFKLDREKMPYVVAGVPPDYFSRTGQLWGNPIFNWDALRETGYAWWIKRFERWLALCDFLRIDHFRGFVGYWEIPADRKTAVEGRWVEAPAVDFFDRLSKRFTRLPIIAEDLGVITPDVREVMQLFGFPGMKVLLFAFGSDMTTNPYIPHNAVRNCIFYTGTHDNNTIMGWFENEASSDDRERLFRYIGRRVPLDELNWELIRLVMMSVSNVVIIPMQDLLGLGQEARMNRPSTTEGNWTWRLRAGELTDELAERLGDMTSLYGRA